MPRGARSGIVRRWLLSAISRYFLNWTTCRSQKLTASSEKTAANMTVRPTSRPSLVRRSSKAPVVSMESSPLTLAQAGPPVHPLPFHDARKSVRHLKGDQRAERIQADFPKHNAPGQHRPLLIDQPVEREDHRPVHEGRRGDD